MFRIFIYWIIETKIYLSYKKFKNYDIKTATRTGTPNAFAYFTQISWYAFLRRIEKEKKQQDIKLKYIANVGIDDLVDTQDGDANPDESTAFVDNLRSRIDGVRANDLYWKDIVTEEKKKTRKRRAVNVDSDLKDFLE